MSFRLNVGLAALFSLSVVAGAFAHHAPSKDSGDRNIRDTNRLRQITNHALAFGAAAQA